jgi:hypothetical protein
MGMHALYCFRTLRCCMSLQKRAAACPLHASSSTPVVHQSSRCTICSHASQPEKT